MLEFFRNISPVELIIIVLIFLFFFGAQTVRTLAKRSGETAKEMKKVKNEFTKALEDDDEPSKD